MNKHQRLWRSNQNTSRFRPIIPAGIRSQAFQSHTEQIPIHRLGFLFVILYSLCVSGWTVAADLTLFGPEVFVRGSGSPVVETRTFPIANTTQPHTLHVVNGGLQNDGSNAEFVSSSEHCCPVNFQNRAI